MHNSTVNFEFYRFLAKKKNNVLTRNGQSFKKYQRQKKVHNSIISRENREFCPIFIKIITYVQGKKKKKTLI